MVKEWTCVWRCVMVSMTKHMPISPPSLWFSRMDFLHIPLHGSLVTMCREFLSYKSTSFSFMNSLCLEKYYTSNKEQTNQIMKGEFRFNRWTKFIMDTTRHHECCQLCMRITHRSGGRSGIFWQIQLTFASHAILVVSKIKDAWMKRWEAKKAETRLMLKDSLGFRVHKGYFW